MCSESKDHINYNYHDDKEAPPTYYKGKEMVGFFIGVSLLCMGIVFILTFYE